MVDVPAPFGVPLGTDGTCPCSSRARRYWIWARRRHRSDSMSTGTVIASSAGREVGPCPSGRLQTRSSTWGRPFISRSETWISSEAFRLTRARFVFTACNPGESIGRCHSENRCRSGGDFDSSPGSVCNDCANCRIGSHRGRATHEVALTSRLRLTGGLTLGYKGDAWFPDSGAWVLDSGSLTLPADTAMNPG